MIKRTGGSRQWSLGISRLDSDTCCDPCKYRRSADKKKFRKARACVVAKSTCSKEKQQSHAYITYICINSMRVFIDARYEWKAAIRQAGATGSRGATSIHSRGRRHPNLINKFRLRAVTGTRRLCGTRPLATLARPKDRR